MSNNDPRLTRLLDVIYTFVNRARPDCYAIGRNDENGKFGYRTCRKPITPEVLQAHLNSDPPVGVYLMRPSTDVTNIAVLDFDDHQGDLTWDDMREPALRVMNLARRFGLGPLPVRSGGGKGIHLLFWWSTEQKACDVRDLLRLIIDAEGFEDGDGGVARKQIEVFPKQDAVAPGAYGNLIAVPFARESRPLDKTLLTTLVPEVWPSSAPVPPAASAEEIEAPEAEGDALIVGALACLPADNYRDWIRIGLAIKRGRSEAGYAAWNEWSKRSARYCGENEARKVWNSLKPQRVGGVTLGSVFYLAKQTGWTPPKASVSEDTFAEFVDILAARVLAPAFPVESLPQPFRDYVVNRAAVMQVQPDLIAGPMLAVAAIMLGRDWRIQPQCIQPSWTEPSTIWIANIAQSGSMKSAAAKVATRFVHRLQSELNDKYKELLMDWHNEKDHDQEAKPLLESCYTSDATVESVKSLLSDEHNANPRGILFDSDELAGWIHGLNQYKSKGNDRQIYLHLYDGDAVRIDRKKDGDPTFIPRSALSICGGAQPAVLRSLFANGDDGLTPRFQVVWPEPYGEVKLQTVEEDREAWKKVADRLRLMRTAIPISNPDLECDSAYFGEPLKFNTEAQLIFDHWYVKNRNRGEQGVFGSYIEKQRGLLARLSMILHGMKHGDGLGSKLINEETLRAAMKQVEYFEDHTRKMYGIIDAHPARPGALKIAQWIRNSKRMDFTIRNIRQHDWSEFSKENDEGVILASLRYLEARGWVRLEEKMPGKSGGRPTLRAHVNPLAFDGD